MKKIIDGFKALGEENRLRIIKLLCREEMCVCELLEKMDLSQSAVSHHIRILKQAGLIKDRRQGKWIFYSLNREAFQALGLMMQNNIWDPVQQSQWLEKDNPSVYCENKKTGHM